MSSPDLMKCFRRMSPSTAFSCSQLGFQLKAGTVSERARWGHTELNEGSGEGRGCSLLVFIPPLKGCAGENKNKANQVLSQTMKQGEQRATSCLNFWFMIGQANSEDMNGKGLKCPGGSCVQEDHKGLVT